MRLGSSLVSLALHIALGIGGITVAPALVRESEPVPMFDIELVTISEVTNLRPAAAEEVAEEEVTPEEPPPPPEPEEVPIPEEAAPPPPPKEEPKPEPKKEEPLDFQKEIERAMRAANAAAPAPAKKEEKPANPFKNANRRNTAAGAGDGAMVRIEQYIMRQILDNGCWSKQTGLADAQTMSATIRVRFGRDGRFSEEPKLIDPARMPSGGPFLVYVTRAVSGLNKCNNIGFKVPAEYFTDMKSPTIDLRFQPGAE